MIDNAKVVCLFLVLFCHIPPTSGFFHTFSYIFHVPLFFFVAGMFYKNRSISDVVTHSARTLLLPYFAFNVLLIAILVTISLVGNYGFSSTENLLYPILGVILGSSGTTAPFKLPGGPSWFLMALFVARVVFSIILHSKKKFIIFEVLLLVVIYQVVRHYLCWAPFSVTGAIIGLPFMVLGYMYKDKILAITHAKALWRVVLIILTLVLVAICASANGFVDMFQGSYGRYFTLYLLGGFTGCLMIIVICSFMDFSNRFTRLIIEGSTFFLCLHMTIMNYVQLIYRRTFGVSHELLVFDKLIISIAVIAIIYVSLVVIKKFFPRMLKF